VAARQPGLDLRRALDPVRRRRELEHRRKAGAAREAAGAGLDAPLKQAFAPRRRHAGGKQRTVDDFSLSQLGFQIRYRYELAPLSDLYVVYGRGGDVFHEYSDNAFDLMRDAFDCATATSSWSRSATASTTKVH
jgi:hypothetical protein